MLGYGFLKLLFGMGLAFSAEPTRCDWVLKLSKSFPETSVQVEAHFQFLEHSVYAPIISEWRQRATSLSRVEKEKLWRMSTKNAWRQSDFEHAALPERRMKLLTNRERKAFDWGGADENADPAAPFVIHANDVRPTGMPTGSYSLSSGKTGYLYSSTEKMLRNENPVAFEIEFQQVSHDGRIAVQQGGYASPDGSWGWDGRFELQPDGKGDHELIMTQGAMELPVNLVGSDANAPLSPQVSRDNEFRSRHLFRLTEWVPSKNNHPAKLIVRDEGSIFRFKPTTEHRWIQADSKGKLLHAHGYGENFLPDDKDPRKLWTDAEGYSWRVFDMVTEETTLDSKRFVPTETRSVAVAMDRKDASRIDKNKPFVFLTSNRRPDTSEPYPATVRYAYDTSGVATEKRFIHGAGHVDTVTQNISQNTVALLNEGLNFFQEPITLKNKSYFVGTNSAGEYTSGGLREDGQKFYGTYLWYREASQGRIGEYLPVLDESGHDLKDMFREVTQMYGGSWGIGRVQLFKEGNEIWAKAHMVDVDLLPNDRERFPLSGYPREGEVFTHSYRRHQILIPVRFIEKKGQPFLEVADPQVTKDLKAWRKRNREKE